MRTTTLVLALTLLMVLPVMAQEAPKGELFGGYSYLRSNGLNFNGWDGSVAQNVNDYFGLKFNVSGHYKTTGQTGQKVEDWVHTILFGPQFTYRKHDRITPFFHTMLGMTVETLKVEVLGVSADDSFKYFAALFGGGLEVKITDSVAFRAVQADWLYNRSNGDTGNGLRLTAGFTYRF